MTEQTRTAALQWLNSLGVRDPSNLPVEDYARVKSLLGLDRPGFGIFLSMMQFERQKAVIQLTNADLGNSTGAVKAAKLQGIVSCIDTMRELVLDIADPSGEGSNADPREVAGVRFNGERSEQQPV